MHRASNPLNDTVRSSAGRAALRSVRARRAQRRAAAQRHHACGCSRSRSRSWLLLAGRPGDVVTREEIQAEVWPAGHLRRLRAVAQLLHPPDPRRARRQRASPRATSRRCRGAATAGSAGPVERVTSGATLREWPRPIARTRCAPGRGERRPSAVPIRTPRRRAGRLPARGAPAPRGRARLARASSRGARRRPLARGRRDRRRSRGSGRVASSPRARRRRPSRPRSSASPSAAGSSTRPASRPTGRSSTPRRGTAQPRELHVTRSDRRDFRAARHQGRAWSSASRARARSRSCATASWRGRRSRAGPPKEVLKGVARRRLDARTGADFAVARWVDGRTPARVPGRPRARAGARATSAGCGLARRPLPRLHRAPGARTTTAARGRGLRPRRAASVAACDEWGSLEGLAWAPAAARSGSRPRAWAPTTRCARSRSTAACAPCSRGMGRLVLHDAAPDGRLLLERATLRSEMLFRARASPRTATSPGSTSRRRPRSRPTAPPSSSTRAARAAARTTPPSCAGPTAPSRSAWARAARSGSPRTGSGCSRFPCASRTAWTCVPIGPGEPRQVRIAGAAAHETAGFVGDGRTIFVSTRDAGREARDLARRAPTARIRAGSRCPRAARSA